MMTTNKPKCPGCGQENPPMKWIGVAEDNTVGTSYIPTPKHSLTDWDNLIVYVMCKLCGADIRLDFTLVLIGPAEEDPMNDVHGEVLWWKQ